MGLLGKRSSDFEMLDYTLLQKRGILKIPQQEKAQDVIDFTQAASPSSAPIQTAYSALASDNPFGMLDTFAQMGATTPSSSNTEIAPSSSSEVQALKIKIEDLEYKLERLVEKIAKMDSSV